MKIWAITFGQVFVVESESLDSGEVEPLGKDDLSLHATVTGPIISHVSRPPNNPTPAEFEKLLSATREWLTQELSSSKSKEMVANIDLLLSPFEIVKVILPVADSPYRVSQAIEDYLSTL